MKTKSKRGVSHHVRGSVWWRALAGSCALAWGLSGSPAFADDNKALAQSLFESGLALVKQGNYVDACPKLEESQKLDPQIGTLFHLASCQEQTHKLASAWANFVSVAARARSANKLDHAKEAQARADALKVRLTRIMLLVADENKQAAGFEVRLDDVVIGSASFGVPLPIDAAKHVIKVSATDKRTWQTTVEAAGEGAVITVSIPALKEEPAVGPLVTTPQTPGGDSGNPRATVGLVMGGAGLLGLGVGAALAIAAKSAYDPSASHCNTAGQCDPEGIKMRKNGIALADGATVALIAGGAVLAGGAAVWLTAPRTGPEAKPAVAVVPGFGSLFITGSF